MSSRLGGGGEAGDLAQVLHLLFGLLTILVSAWLFTNGVEWFGLRLGVAHGALGSVFAALGTALPEASIAILAAVAPGPGRSGALGDAVSIGAILGAPLLLATVGFGILGMGCLYAGRSSLRVTPHAVARDLVFFLCVYGSVTAAGIVGPPAPVRTALGLLLVVAYGIFVTRTLAAPGAAGTQGADPRRLLFAPNHAGEAPWSRIAVQLLVAVAVMFVGAELFVHTLTDVSAALGLSGFVLAALIAPLATELPETVNSLVWIAQDKDALGTGNVTGALVLQGAVIPGIGMLLVPWRFDRAETVAALVALGGSAAVYGALRLSGRLARAPLLAVGLLYLAFVIWVL